MKLEVNQEYRYWGKCSPVIPPLTKVKLLHIWNFPATGKIFLTIEDLENKNIGRNGQEETIISTVPYTYPTEMHSTDYLHDEPKPEHSCTTLPATP